MGAELYFDCIENIITEIRADGMKSISAAAGLVADAVMGGGMVHAYGSGHSRAAAMEISRRAGGLVPVKLIDEPSQGRYEKINGVGFEFMMEYDLRPNDVLIVISNTGINPLPVEIAACAKKIGCKLIAVTSLEVSKQMEPKNTLSKKLYEFADVILDTRGVYGDAAIELDGVKSKVCGTSSVINDILLNGVMLEAIELMVDRGYEPPVLLSGNIEGGEEYGRKLAMKYASRMLQNHIYYR